MRVAATLSQPAASAAPLIDGIGRRISYLRLSVTDRCDLRCRYCMAEDMTFLPKSAVLSIEEMGELAERFVARGINRIRLTGGEPLAQPDAFPFVTRPDQTKLLVKFRIWCSAQKAWFDDIRIVFWFDC